MSDINPEIYTAAEYNALRDDHARTREERDDWQRRAESAHKDWQEMQSSRFDARKERDDARAALRECAKAVRPCDVCKATTFPCCEFGPGAADVIGEVRKILDGAATDTREGSDG